MLARIYLPALFLVGFTLGGSCSPGSRTLSQDEGSEQPAPLESLEGCGSGSLTCSSGLCLCSTPGTKVGFMTTTLDPSINLQAANSSFKAAAYQRVRNDRAGRSFTQLVMPMLPGSDDVKLRKLWEYVTGLVSENLLDQEPGSHKNNRTGAWARACGGISVSGTSTRDSAHEDQDQCRKIHLGESDEPALVTALENMTDVNPAIPAMLTQASLAVFIIRNPVDHYQAYLRKLKDMRAEAKADLFDATPEGQMEEVLMEGAEVMVGGVGAAAGVIGVAAEAGALVGRRRRVSHRRSLLLQTSTTTTTRGSSSSSSSVDSAVHRRRRLHQAAALLPPPNTTTTTTTPSSSSDSASSPPPGPPTVDGVPGHEVSSEDAVKLDFAVWLQQQWLLYATAILQSQRTNKETYVFKYEELMEDPSGIYYDFLLSTGVGQRLGLGKRVLSALAHKSLRKGDSKLVELDPTGKGFWETGGPSLVALLDKHQDTLNYFGYQYFRQAEASAVSLAETAETQRALRREKSDMALRMGGDIVEDQAKISQASAATQGSWINQLFSGFG